MAQVTACFHMFVAQLCVCSSVVCVPLVLSILFFELLTGPTAHRQFAAKLLVGQQGRQKEDMLGCLGGHDQAKISGWFGYQGYRAFQLGPSRQVSLENITRPCFVECPGAQVNLLS